MSGIIKPGPRTWAGGRDEMGYRTYKVTFRVQVSSSGDGPATVLQTPGLYLPGSPYTVDNDVDLWAWCTPEIEITPVHPEGEANYWYDVTQTFTNKPPGSGGLGSGPGSGPGSNGSGSGAGSGCGNAQIENPLMEPPKIGGGFSKNTEEISHDRFKKAIRTSSHEMIKGPMVEFDKNRPTLKIEVNTASFNQVVTALSMIDKVNDRKLWGFTARCVKLSNVSWDRKFYGLCLVYYTLLLEFDMRMDTFDHVAVDEGTKVLSGHWDTATGIWVLDNIVRNGVSTVPDALNPTHFVRYRGRDAEVTRVLLNGRGLPWERDSSVVDGNAWYPNQLCPTSGQANCGVASTIQLDVNYIEGHVIGGIGAGTGSFWARVPGVGNRSVSVRVWRGVNAAGTAYDTSIDPYTFTIYQGLSTNCPGTQLDTFSDFLPISQPGVPAGSESMTFCLDGVVNQTGADLYIEVRSAGFPGNELTFDFVVTDLLCNNKASTPGSIRIEYYDEANFLLLGIPGVFQ